MARALARPIKTRRDRKSAAAITRKSLKRAGQEPDAEHRLQALLHEIEKFDNEGNEGDFDEIIENVDGLPQRRWSDDRSDEA